jgi:A/G-specific adenine glycosylase
MSRTFAQRLLRWFDQHGRKHLPWQNPITPYRVWVSEIMLQQTQVETVIPYFERFMQRFPNLQALADAPIDEVLHHWTGLGYYARARNLHRCAQIVATEYAGEFPADVELIAQLPGIGRSTAAAITSIAFEQPTAILDGNVKRVLARHSAIPGWPAQPKVAEKLWQVAESHMPKKRCRDYTQAIMDLGATVCVRSRPKCALCPVAEDCIALVEDNPTAYPGKKPAKDKPIKRAYFLLLQAPNGDILLERRPPQGIWGGLWCLPEVPVEQTSGKKSLDKHLAAYGPTRGTEHWEGWRHTFSHYHLDIQPVLVKLAKRPQGIMEEGRHLWYNVRQPANVGLAAPVKLLLQKLLQPRQVNLL